MTTPLRAVLLAALLLAGPAAPSRAHEYEEPGAPLAVFRPAPLAPEASAIVDSGRGLYKWNDQGAPYVVPLPQPHPDVFRRFAWREVEPAKDRYDFSQLDALAAEARDRGGKFMFKIYGFCTAWCSRVALPDYFLDRGDPDYLAKGWWYQRAYVPDWNDPRFLERARKLLEALGRRYGRDSRLGVVEIGIYGNWGEWHTWPLSYPSPTGAEQMTDEHQRELIDMHARAFPAAQLVVMRGGTASAAAVMYAMSLSAATDPPVARPVGWAADCWGDPAEEDDLPSLPQWPALRDRWRAAPVMGEICGTLDARSRNWPALPRHVADYHVSLLGNGNIGGDGVWSHLPKAAQASYRLAGELSGYRYVLRYLLLPPEIRAGAAFEVDSLWANAGVAPAYDPWSVAIQLRDPASGAVAWEGLSRLDLRRLLPGDGERMVDDSFRPPANLAPGRYDVTIQIRDTTTDYRAPLALAIAGRQDDGSYRLGMVTIV